MEQNYIMKTFLPGDNNLMQVKPHNRSASGPLAAAHIMIVLQHTALHSRI